MKAISTEDILHVVQLIASSPVAAFVLGILAGLAIAGSFFRLIRPDRHEVKSLRRALKDESIRIAKHRREAKDAIKRTIAANEELAGARTSEEVLRDRIERIQRLVAQSESVMLGLYGDCKDETKGVGLYMFEACEMLANALREGGEHSANLAIDEDQFFKDFSDSIDTNNITDALDANPMRRIVFGLGRMTHVMSEHASLSLLYASGCRFLLDGAVSREGKPLGTILDDLEHYWGRLTAELGDSDAGDIPGPAAEV